MMGHRDTTFLVLSQSAILCSIVHKYIYHIFLGNQNTLLYKVTRLVEEQRVQQTMKHKKLLL